MEGIVLVYGNYWANLFIAGSLNPKKLLNLKKNIFYGYKRSRSKTTQNIKFRACLDRLILSAFKHF